MLHTVQSLLATATAPAIYCLLFAHFDVVFGWQRNTPKFQRHLPWANVQTRRRISRKKELHKRKNFKDGFASPILLREIQRKCHFLFNQNAIHGTPKKAEEEEI